MKLGYIILYVHDVGAAIAFYEHAFGLTRRFLHESGQYGEMQTGGTALAFASETMVASSVPGFRPNRPGEPPAGAEVGLVTDDVRAAFDHAIRAGATGHAEPREKPWGQTVAYGRATNGFLVELCSEITGEVAGDEST